MSFIVWNEDFLTGVDIVDQQHHTLVEMVNSAAPKLLLCSPAEQADRQRLFADLVAYTAEHFKTEEALMQDVGIDARVLTHHKQTHAQLVEEVVAWESHFSCSDPLAGQQLLGFLAGWLLMHVLGEDQTMARQVHARQAGLSAEQAYETGEGSRLTPKGKILSRALVAAYTQLSAQMREISLMNHHLEDQVQARTAQLQTLADELRSARDAAEAANQAKTRFLGMVSHELRTPMNAIVGFNAALRQSGLGAQQVALAEHVSTASGHLLGVISSLIEYAEGDDQASNTFFDLHRCVQEATSDAFNQARTKGLATELQIDSALPAVLQGDSRRIGLIVKQLTANAVKFTAHGSVRVRAHLDKTAETATNGLTTLAVPVRIDVLDTGIGLTPEQQKGLFEPFHQVDDSATRHYAGVGMGLALTRQAARVLGGDIGLRSVPGRGSDFWLSLNLTLPPAGAVPALDSAGTSAAHATDHGRLAAVVKPKIEVSGASSALLAELATLLAADDTRAAALLDAHRPALRVTLGASFDGLAAQITDFEYDVALATLRKHMA
jgi:hemerythrin-like metal-binding protein